MDTCNRLEAGKWSEGRPVFKKVDGEERFLLVKEEWNRWTIRGSLTGPGAFIKSGRATISPTSPEAGPCDRNGTTKWLFKDLGNKWVEGDISLTCKSDDDNEDGSNDGDEMKKKKCQIN